MIAIKKDRGLLQSLSDEIPQFKKKFYQPSFVPALLLLAMVWFLGLIMLAEVIQFHIGMGFAGREWCDEFRPEMTYKACSGEFSQ